MGFWVAATIKSGGRRQLFLPTVIWCSAMASSRADCTLAGARFISSASTRWLNKGPGWNTKLASCG
ncbi:hypothetical protein D3C80_2025560 [compost metagenome]